MTIVIASCDKSLLTLTQYADVFVVKAVAASNPEVVTVQNGRLITNAVGVIRKDYTNALTEECSV